MIAVGALSWHRHSVKGSQPPYPGHVVPCGSCTACCQGVAVALYPPVDDPAQYETVDGRLATQANGDCTYFQAGACTIYARRPLVCRTFDCRALLVTDVRQPQRIWEAAAAKFQIVAKAPGDAQFLVDVRAKAADVLAHGGAPKIAVQAALDGRPIRYEAQA